MPRYLNLELAAVYLVLHKAKLAWISRVVIANDSCSLLSILRCRSFSLLLPSRRRICTRRRLHTARMISPSGQTTRHFCTVLEPSFMNQNHRGMNFNYNE